MGLDKHIQKPRPMRSDSAPEASDRLAARAYSKDNLAPDRAKLASEIQQERSEQREQLSALRARAESLASKIAQIGAPVEEDKKELGNLAAHRTAEANTLVGRIKRFLPFQKKRETLVGSDPAAQTLAGVDSTEQRALLERELQACSNQLIELDVAMAKVKEKLADHYKNIPKRIDQTMRRTGAFFVHTMNDEEYLREGPAADTFDLNNSIKARNTSFENEVDLVIAFEPSIATSSVLPGRDEQGRVSGLWSSQAGLIIGGGSIAFAGDGDLASKTVGLTSRIPDPARLEETKQSIEAIDAIVGSRSGNAVSRYNEIVVDEPKIFGMFKSAEYDSEGSFWIKSGGYDAKNTYEHIMRDSQNPLNAPYQEERLKEFETKAVDPFRQRMMFALSRGIPFYVMTPDRTLFECLDVERSGKLKIGKELTIEQVCASPLKSSPAEVRKKIGEELLQGGVFRSDTATAEARQIIHGL